MPPENGNVAKPATSGSVARWAASPERRQERREDARRRDDQRRQWSGPAPVWALRNLLVRHCDRLGLAHGPDETAWRSEADRLLGALQRGDLEAWDHVTSAVASRLVWEDTTPEQFRCLMVVGAGARPMVDPCVREADFAAWAKRYATPRAASGRPRALSEADEADIIAAIKAGEYVSKGALTKYLRGEPFNLADTTARENAARLWPIARGK